MTQIPQDRVEAIGSQLREKIGSKFQTSAFLGGFGFTVFGIQLTFLWGSNDIPRYLSYSVASIAAAICLYVAALVMLDKLTMPKKFWKPKKKTDDLTQEKRILTQNGLFDMDDLKEIKNRMVFYWIYLDYMGIALTFVSLMLSFLPVQPIYIDESNGPTRVDVLNCTFYSSSIAIFIVLVYFFVLWIIGKYIKKFKPLFNFPD